MFTSMNFVNGHSRRLQDAAMSILRKSNCTYLFIDGHYWDELKNLDTPQKDSNDISKGTRATNSIGFEKIATKLNVFIGQNKK